MSSPTSRQTPVIEDETDEEFDWEEIEVPEQPALEITLDARPKSIANKKKGISYAERVTRLNCHKIHTIALLGSAWVRNKWINDSLLHARLLSLAPLPLQTAFGMIHKSRIPDPNQRGRMFEAAITRLVEWWIGFFEVSMEGHLRNRTFDEVQNALSKHGCLVQSDASEVLDVEDLQDILDDDGEQIRSPKSLMKHALMQKGSRDISAQLFTALCRALGIPARLVVSLQSLPWQSKVGKPKPKYKRGPKGKGKAKEVVGLEEGGEGDMEEVAIRTSGSSHGDSTAHAGFMMGGRRLDGEPAPQKSEKAKGKEKEKPPIKLRKTKSKGNRLGSPDKTPVSYSIRADPTSACPVFWTEVFSKADIRWLPVDPIRGIVNKRKVFDPSPSVSATPHPSSTLLPHSMNPPIKQKAPTKQENRLVYVIAFEEDGYARDVTPRYARDYGAKVAKEQGGNGIATGGGKGKQKWWEQVVGCVRRPYQLHRDDVEDEELETAQMMEGMPATVSGFKGHPLYVLTRHLKQTETIYPAPPATPELGKFRGEPVYPRSSVVSLKTSENWMRSEGRSVKSGCQPLKFVKTRAGTVNRMRELEVMRDDLKEAGSAGPNSSAAGGEVMQGLYARNQTELYTPTPVIDGKIPKNNFGNIDLYVPSMLPRGAVHVPFKGTAKIARMLGFDYAEAVTGFEFKKRRAFPVIEGVVVAQEHEQTLLEAYWEAEQDAEEKARLKREDRVIKQWTRLIHGLRIRQRLQEQYAKPKEPAKEVSVDGEQPADPEPLHQGGGFLVEADDVVQVYRLPKSQHVELPISKEPSPVDDPDQPQSPEQPTYALETMDVDPDMELAPIPVHAHAAAVPRTMQELAEEAEEQENHAVTSDEDFTVGVVVEQPASPLGSGLEPDRNARSRRPGSTRKRGRKSGDDSDDDFDISNSPAPSPRKRTRTKGVVPPAVPTSTRVLRSRTASAKTPK